MVSLPSCRRCRNRVRGSGDVSLDGHSLGKQGTRRGAHLLAGEADRAQSVGTINRARSGLGDRRLADSDADRGLYELTAAALTPCALFAIGLGLSVEDVR